VTTGKLISLSKSREYTKLAGQVPNILTIKDGRPVLGPLDHQGKNDSATQAQFAAGGSVITGKTSHERYLKSLE